MPTTGRVTLTAGLLAVLNTYRTANPTKLRRVYSARPGGVGEVPFAFVGHRDETIVHTAGTRQRTITPTVTVCDHLGDNEQSAGRMDILVDALVDAFTAAPNLGGGILRQTGLLDSEEQFGGPDSVVSYLATTLVFELVLMEGRN